MEYTRESLNRQTGELDNISLGEWVTITELGSQYGVGNRTVRSILVKMDFMFVAQGGRGARSRTKICPWVVERGWGKHHYSKNGFPFDVINEDAQAWIAERWQETKAEVEGLSPGLLEAKDACNSFFSRRVEEGETPEARIQVKWLMDHFPGLTQSDIARIADVSQQLVSKFAKQFEARLKEASVLKASIGRPC